MAFISSATGTRTTGRHRTFAAAKKKASALAVKAVKMADGDGQFYVENEETGRVESYRIPMPRNNPGKSRTISLKSFTGKVRQLANGALQISGRGKKG